MEPQQHESVVSSSTNGEPARLTLTARGLEVSYDATVALTIPELTCEGSVIGIVGHNGAGKSTFIKSVLGLLPLSAGTLASRLSMEKSLQTLVPESDMAFCPETGAVFADISVESYVKLWCRIKHGDPKYYRKRGSEIVELLNLAPLLSKLGRELSKGQRRRVQTTIGFLTEPKLFLFDEPFDGLDVQRTSELADIIMARRHRTAFVISSHRMEVMERMADQLLVLKQGSVASAGPIEKVCRDLAGATYVISKLKDLERARSAIQAKMPRALVTKIGSQLFLTDRTISPSLLKECLAVTEQPEAVLETAPPRLVDAVNYHLAEMQRESLH